MEHEKLAVEVQQENPMYQVTPLSKYLALALFIVMPFLGGWIGYEYAPEKIVVVETVVVREPLTDAGSVMLEPEQLTELAKEQGFLANANEGLVRTLYETEDGKSIYFLTGVVESDDCCNLLEFNIEEQKFMSRDEWFDNYIDSQISNDGRYIATVSSDGLSLRLVDLETRQLIFEDKLTTGSLHSSPCSLAGYANDITFSEDRSVLIYGVYSDKSVPGDVCSFELLEKKEHEINMYSWVNACDESIEVHFSRDDENVYYEKKIISGADPETFLVIPTPPAPCEEVYARDASQVFYKDKVILGANPNKFKIYDSEWLGWRVMGPYSRDDKNVYYEDRRIDGADTTTFTAFYEGKYASDNNAVYLDGVIVEGADPQTFSFPVFE